MPCIRWNQLSVVYYKLLQLDETITEARYRVQLPRLKEKRAIYEQRHEKVILIQGTYCSGCERLPENRTPYSNRKILQTALLFQSMMHSLAEQHSRSKKKPKIRLNKRAVFSIRNPHTARKTILCRIII